MRAPATSPRKPLTLTAVENAWTRRAIAAAIQEARKIVWGGPLLSRTPIGTLTEAHWGWIASAAIAAWIQTRAQQAIANGQDGEEAVLVTGLKLEPFDAALIPEILPQLGRSRIDMSKTFLQLTRDEVLTFLGDVVRLLNKAARARDRGRCMSTDRAPDGSRAIDTDVA